jgi:hypothetical protein
LGKIVAGRLPSSTAERANLIKKEVEALAVEAKKLGLELEDVMEAMQNHWERFEKTERVSGGRL